MNLGVVTITAPPISTDHEGCKRLRESLNYHGYKSIWLVGTRFHNFYTLKLRDLAHSVRQLKGFTHILYTDANDTVAAAPPDEVIHKYQQFQSPMVMSGGNTCYPDTAYYNDFASGSWRFPNAGQWICEFETLLNYFNEFDRHWAEHGGRMNRDKKGWNRFVCDQLSWTAALVEKRVAFKLDTECQIFQSMYDTSWNLYRRQGERFMNTQTGSQPCFFHSNGSRRRKKMAYELADKLKELR